MLKPLSYITLAVFVLMIFYSFALHKNDNKCALHDIETAPPRTLLFDLNGVLINPAASIFGLTFNSLRLRFMWELGPRHLLSYMFWLGKSPTAMNRSFYNLLMKIDPTSINVPGASNNTAEKLPGLMCDWLTGTKNGPEIEQIIISYLDAHSTDFAPEENILFKRLAHAMFDPLTYVSLCKIPKESIAFIKQMKACGYRVCILSNWDPLSFEVIRQHHPELFDLFDEKDIFISGNLKLLKPDVCIYEEVLKQVPQPCLAIDDQIENLEAAQQCRMQTFLFKSYADKDVKKLMSLLCKNKTD
jgi:beta-phosphoglucomutase-like phosphatase (HAD superfamily)